jgi:hypothetical protein
MIANGNLVLESTGPTLAITVSNGIIACVFKTVIKDVSATCTG